MMNDIVIRYVCLLILSLLLQTWNYLVRLSQELQLVSVLPRRFTDVGELLWKKLRVTNSFAIHYTHQIQWNGVSLNIIGSHNFYNVGVRLATYANKVPSDGIVGEFYSIPSGFTDIKVVYKNWDVYVVFTVVQGQSVYFKYDCSTQCDIIKDIGFIDESYKEIKPIA